MQQEYQKKMQLPHQDDMELGQPGRRYEAESKILKGFSLTLSRRYECFVKVPYLKVHNCTPLLQIILGPAQSQSILVSISPLTDDLAGAGLGPENLIFSLNFNQATGHRLMASNDDECFNNFFLIFSDKKIS